MQAASTSPTSVICTGGGPDKPEATRSRSMTVAPSFPQSLSFSLWKLQPIFYAFNLSNVAYETKNAACGGNTTDLALLMYKNSRLLLQAKLTDTRARIFFFFFPLKTREIKLCLWECIVCRVARDQMRSTTISLQGPRDRQEKKERVLRLEKWKRENVNEIQVPLARRERVNITKMAAPSERELDGISFVSDDARQPSPKKGHPQPPMMSVRKELQGFHFAMERVFA